MAGLEHAIHLAAKYHAGQRDKAGIPYIAHICAVVAGCETVQTKIIAALHDIVEDTPVTLREIRLQFGDLVADAVDALTKRPGEDYISYLNRVKENPHAHLVKIADLRHNMDPSRGVAINSKYPQALDFLSPAPAKPERRE